MYNGNTHNWLFTLSLSGTTFIIHEKLRNICAVFSVLLANGVFIYKLQRHPYPFESTFSLIYKLDYINWLSLTATVHHSLSETKLQFYRPVDVVVVGISAPKGPLSPGLACATRFALRVDPTAAEEGRNNEDSTTFA